MAVEYGLPERLSRRIQVDQHQCWLWQGATVKGGYGNLRFGNRTFLVHRFVFELLVGPVPDGFELHHRCKVRNCCNPAHLEVKTTTEHRHLSRRTHCMRGHELTPENSHYFRNGKRCCRICQRAGARRRTARWRAKQKGKAWQSNLA